MSQAVFLPHSGDQFIACNLTAALCVAPDRPQVIEEVEVEVETREDMWALKLLGMIARLQQLLATGMTRELRV